MGSLSQTNGYSHPIDEWVPESAIADVGSELDTINEQGESQCTTLTDARSASKHTSSFLPQPDEVSEALSNPRGVAPAKHWYVNPDYGSLWRLRDSGEQVVFAMDPQRPPRHQLHSGHSKWMQYHRYHAQQINSPSRTSLAGSSTAYSSVQSEDLSLRATTEPEPHWTADRPYLSPEAHVPHQQLHSRSSYGDHSLVLAMPSDAYPIESDGSPSGSSPASADYNFFTSPPMGSVRTAAESAIPDTHLRYPHSSPAGSPVEPGGCSDSPVLVAIRQNSATFAHAAYLCTCGDSIAMRDYFYQGVRHRHRDAET